MSSKETQDQCTHVVPKTDLISDADTGEVETGLAGDIEMDWDQKEEAIVRRK